MKITMPGLKRPIISNGNGRPSSNASTEQHARLSDYQRALNAEATWKAVSKLLGGALIASMATMGIMVIKFAPVAFAYEREPDGTTHFAGQAHQQVAPGDVAINASIVTYIRDLREIPGGDFRLVDEHLRVAHRSMTVPGSPAEHDELAFWEAHNPKAEARSMTRIVVNKNPTPTCSRLGDSLTFSCVFGEQVRDSQGNLTTVARTGMVTMKNEPVLPTDNVKAIDNAGGIDVWSISHSLVEE